MQERRSSWIMVFRRLNRIPRKGPTLIERLVSWSHDYAEPHSHTVPHRLHGHVHLILVRWYLFPHLPLPKASEDRAGCGTYDGAERRTFSCALGVDSGRVLRRLTTVLGALGIGDGAAGRAGRAGRVWE